MLTTLFLAAALIQDPRVDVQYVNHVLAYPLAPVASTFTLGPVQVQNSTYYSNASLGAYGWTDVSLNNEPIADPNYDSVEFTANFYAMLDPNYIDKMQENSACYYKTKFYTNGNSILRIEYLGTVDPQNNFNTSFHIDWDNDGAVDYVPPRTGYLEVFEVPANLLSGPVGVWYLSNRLVDPTVNPIVNSFEFLKLSVVPDTKTINTGPRLYNDAELVWNRLDFYTTAFEPLYNTNPVVMVIGTSLNPIVLQPGEVLQPNSNLYVPTFFSSGRVYVDSQLLGMLPDLWIQGVAVTPNGFQVGNLIRVQ